MLKQIPKILIYSRLLIGILLLALSYAQVKNYPLIATILFTLGLLSDIFDGIVARYLNISTQNLRRLDSTVDQIFFILVLAATYLECPQFFETQQVKLFILLGFEGGTYLFSYLKFGKEVATHAIASKLWTLLIFATLIEIIWSCHSGLLFEFSFYGGLLTRIEILGILFLLRKWTNDVPSIYHAWLLRQGKTIKKHKLFNS